MPVNVQLPTESDIQHMTSEQVPANPQTEETDVNPSLLKRLGGLFLGRLQPRRTEPVQEARQQRLSKSAKVQTGLEAALTNSIYQLDRRERAVANQYMDQKVFGAPVQAPDSSGEEPMIIADDIKIIRNQSGSILGPLVGLLLGGGTLFGAYLLLSNILPKVTDKLLGDDEPPPPAVVQPDTKIPDSSDPTHTHERYNYKLRSRVIPPPEKSERSVK